MSIKSASVNLQRPFNARRVTKGKRYKVAKVYFEEERRKAKASDLKNRDSALCESHI